MTNAGNGGGIQGDPKRQAPDLFKGAIFQLWLSVLAWIGLTDDEVLYLEGAEDLDVASATSATVTQARATASSVSLGTAEILAAVSNFWEIKGKNPKQSIFYHYVTTSAVTNEKGSPFGNGVCGINVWNGAVAGSRNLKAIKKFLVAKLPADSPVRAFVKGATDEQLFAQLVSRIRWIVQSADNEQLEQEVRDKLIVHGEKKGVVAQTASAAADTLFRHAATLASLKDARSTNRAKFLELFDGVTQTTISQDALSQLLSKLNLEATLPGERLLLSGPISLIEAAPPPRPPTLAPRTKLRDAIVEHVGIHVLTILHGSTGSGKTSLAGMVAETQPGIIWASFAGLDIEQSRRLLNEIAAYFRNTSKVAIVVLDDFSFEPASISLTKPHVAALLSDVRAAKSRLVMTSQKPMPQHISDGLGLSPVVNVPVGNFDEDELAELVAFFGCPAETAGLWAKIISLHTNGHPQLTHARLLSLQRDGWPKVSENDLFVPPTEVQEAKAQARILLAEASATQADFIYRLSLIPGSFRRDYALEIGQIEPKVQNPGDIFDRLTGPWIEQVSGAYFRLSPLLEDSATSTWAPSQCTEMREAVGLAIVRGGDMSPHEAYHVLFMGFLAKSEVLLSGVAQSLIYAPAEIKEAVFPRIRWFGDLPATSVPFENNPVLNWLLRTLQLQVAAHNKSDNASKIADVMYAEVFESGRLEDFDGAKMSTVLQIMATPEIKLPAPRLVLFLRKLLEIRKYLIVKEGDEDSPFKGREISKMFDDTGGVGPFIFLLIGQRCEDRQFLIDLLEALDGADAELISLFGDFWKKEPQIARSIVDRVWVEADSLPNPDWPGIMAMLETVFQFARKHKIPVMEDCALKAKIIVLDEHMDKPDEALEIINGPAADRTSAVIFDGKATFFFNRKDFRRALDIWNESFLDPSKWQEGEAHPYLALARRAAGIAASELGLFDEAETHLRIAADEAKDPSLSILPLGLWADTVLCYWIQGKWAEAIKLAYRVVQELQKRPLSKDEDAHAFKLRRTLGQVLDHALSQVEGHAPNKINFRPPFGVCSNMEIPKGMMELLETDVRGLLVYLACLEDQLDLDCGVFRENRVFLASTNIPFVLIKEGLVAASKKLSATEAHSLPELAARQAHNRSVVGAMSKAGLNMAMEPTAVLAVVVSDEERVQSAKFFLAFMVCLILRGELSSETSASLSAACENVEGGKLMEGVVQDYIKYSAMTPDERLAVVKDDSLNYTGKMICSALVVREGNALLQDLFTSQMMLFEGMRANPALRVVGREMSKIFTSQWREQIQARFSLSLPNLTIPAIRDACELPFNNMSKVAAILLEAIPAVGLQVGSDLIEELKRVKGGDLSY